MASQLAATAVQHFNAGSYELALDQLGQIQQQKEDDPKLEHNNAVAQYYHSGCSEPDTILTALSAIKSRIEEHSADADAVYAEENDTSVLSYNEAVLYYQMKQHATSTAILESLFSNIEPIDEGLATKICFLLLDNYWILNNTSKAVAPMAFLDKILEQAGGAPTWTPNADKPCGCPEPIDMASFGLRLHMHKAQFHLLNQSFRSSKKEIKQALNLSPQGSEPTLLKANFEYLRQNYRKSLKLLHSVSKGQDAAAQEQGGKPGNASKRSAVTAAMNNNVACIHFSLNNYNAALWYLSRALKATDAMAHQVGQRVKGGSRAPTPEMFSHCRKSEILYNSGLQLLFTSRPQEAFSCFQEATGVLFHSARLWLRMAECCLAHQCLSLIHI
eukprot:TRINITY_DN19253_c0_g1_i6.p1 TRINITY_DN19253_c0_g1~~TRINITY_DN19253_c0_g1_i6.p1  ORF type:complete len:387 (-),score=108.69 TRINITY_DN19253_c0_g1_i6:169-1329(-)